LPLLEPFHDLQQQIKNRIGKLYGRLTTLSDESRLSFLLEKAVECFDLVAFGGRQRDRISYACPDRVSPRRFAEVRKLLYELWMPQTK